MTIPNYSFHRLEEKVEYCGIVGVYSKTGKPVAPLIYSALLALQHRGQDAAGMVVWNGKFVEKKGISLVSDIFKPEDLKINGIVGIGHTRYPTTGLCKINDVQPFSNKEIAAAHNGQISNYKVIRQKLERRGFKFISSVDSEIIVYMLHEKIKNGAKIEDAVSYLMKTLDGAYSITALVRNKLIAFKDPHGIRPLVWGENKNFIMLASESVALDVVGIPYKGDIGPGELVSIDKGKLSIKKITPSTMHACMFEYVYFSRPDSIINGKNVMEVRKRLGRELAHEHPANVDVVIDVPDSARTAAAEYASALGVPHEEGLIKNRYIGRTFIMPTQEKRRDAVRIKLNVVRSIVAGKRVALVDDSIVRGTTLKEIVTMVKQAGAREVHVRITCPPIRAPCFYGIDMSTYKELAAHNRSIEEIRKMVGADSLEYLSIERLKQVIGIPICTGCLNEAYPTPYAKKLANELK